jgi:hypothetical protein
MSKVSILLRFLLYCTRSLRVNDIHSELKRPFAAPVLASFLALLGFLGTTTLTAIIAYYFTR